MLYIGIDTSCYTSSMAVVNESNDIIFDKRILLKVPDGKRGLRQSEAVFQHSKNLGNLSEECFEKIRKLKEEIICISVSSRPRDVSDSYMPVFTAGHNTAKIIGSCLNLPVYTLSHQQNHIIAGAWSSGQGLADHYLVYHISGGTTELLHANSEDEFQANTIGGTQDLNAGQFIDRVGVALGFSFPCGQQMDNLCSKFTSNVDIEIPFSVKDTFISFSGPETFIQRLVQSREYDSSVICYNTFLCVAKAMEKSIINASIRCKCRDILLVGGVASNSIIKEYLLSSKKLSEKGIKLVYSKKEFSSDNAVGAALFGRRKHNGQ